MATTLQSGHAKSTYCNVWIIPYSTGNVCAYAWLATAWSDILAYAISRSECKVVFALSAGNKKSPSRFVK